MICKKCSVLCSIVLSAVLFSWVSCAHSETRFRVSQSGTIERSQTGIQGGTYKPFFPFGAYHVSWYANSQGMDTWRKRDLDLELMSQMGLNFIQAPLQWSDQKFLDRAQELGMTVGTSFSSPEAYTKFGNHPAVIWLQTFDDIHYIDPKTGIPYVEPAEALDRHQYIKSLLPYKLTYASSGNSVITPTSRSGANDRHSLFVGLSDTFALQAYGYRWLKPRNVFDSLAKVSKQAHEKGSASIANLQTIPNATVADPITRFPDPAYIRNVTYQALLSDVDGIVYYTFFDKNVDLAANDHGPQDALREELALLADELHTFERYLLSGSYRLLSSSDVIAAQWTLGSETLVLLANTNETSSRSISLPVATGATQAKLLFKSGSAQVVNGSVARTLAPFSVEALLLNSSAPRSNNPNGAPEQPKPNEKPIALLGPKMTRSLVDTNNNGIEMITVDASPSYDPDGGAIKSYVWYQILPNSWKLLKMTSEPVTSIIVPTTGDVKILVAVGDDEHSTAHPSYGVSEVVQLSVVRTRQR